MSASLLDAAEVTQLAAALPGWDVTAERLVRTVVAPTFLAGIALVDAVAVAAEELGHHPDIDIRWTRVTFTLSTHSAGGVTGLDAQLARRIDRLADEAGTPG